MDQPKTSGHLHNPWFSDCWYLSTYPDVRQSGLDAARHYEDYGWKEGRDPSGLFSTSWYIAQNPDVAAAGVNPLSHYLSHGRVEGRLPHPGLAAIDHRNRRVAVVVVSFNSATVVEILLASLIRAANETPFTVFLVENGSDPEVKDAVAQLARDNAALLDIRFIDSVANLGFSGGNNLAIVEALKGDYTHICLLNSDVVCTTGWIDALVATGAPVVSPVSNAVGNEQTVPIDYNCALDMDALDAAERFARQRDAAFEQALFRTDFLGFFCVMIERSVVERVGLLDERFYPGSYEDDDYCLRILEAGHELLIARHVYLHHFGSASFSTFAWEQRLSVGNENRARFEDKWQRPWVDRSHLPALSLVQDASIYRVRGESDALLREMVRFGADTFSRHIAGLTAALNHSRLEIETRDRRLLEIAAPGTVADLPVAARPLARITWGEAGGSFATLSENELSVYGALLRAAWQELEQREFISLNILKDMQGFLRQLAELFSDALPALILTQADPVNSDEKDGYVQRVRAVDVLLADRQRLYIRVEDRHRSRPALTELAPDIWQLDIADNDPIGDALLASLFRSGANLYAHSLFGLQGRSVRRLAKDRRGMLVLDLHGSVPEEYAMYGDGFGAQVYGGYEVEAATLIDHLVAVSGNMARHFHEKHGFPGDRITLCPIFVEAGKRVQERSYFVRPRVIYAGGTQKWQQVPKMARLVLEDMGRSDFLFLTPSPDTFLQQCREAGLVEDGHNFSVRSASHAEVLATYEKFDFGILLRERSVVNKVACPTKLIEYLTFGIIPILDTTAVGDFVDLGMQFVSLDDYAAGRIPDIDRRREIAIANWKVLDRLKEQMTAGSAAIRHRMVTETIEARAAA